MQSRQNSYITFVGSFANWEFQPREERSANPVDAWRLRETADGMRLLWLRGHAGFPISHERFAHPARAEKTISLPLVQWANVSERVCSALEVRGEVAPGPADDQFLLESRVQSRTAAIVE
jgi:hypothetical protein